jgi:hypothetical protein
LHEFEEEQEALERYCNASVSGNGTLRQDSENTKIEEAYYKLGFYTL